MSPGVHPDFEFELFYDWNFSISAALYNRPSYASFASLLGLHPVDSNAVIHNVDGAGRFKDIHADGVTADAIRACGNTRPPV